VSALKRSQAVLIRITNTVHLSRLSIPLVIHDLLI
jgi:hypothetical protein